MSIQPEPNLRERNVDRGSRNKTTDRSVAFKRLVELGRRSSWKAEDVESTDLLNQRHYSVAELGKLWNLSEKTIRRIFENEPGVLQWGKTETTSRRTYMTLRIPETVALRVHRRLRIAG